MEQNKHIIDAKNRVLGRLASEIAMILQGKNKPDFAPHREGKNFVIVKNVDKIRVTGKKIENKKYYRHTGYLGGLKETPLKKVFKENPGEVLRRAVLGMLPKNKLRVKMIKWLKIE